MSKNLVVRCPHCETSFEYYQSLFRPFCSEKCKMIDLGHWFKESYRVPLKETDKNTADLDSELENELDNELKNKEVENEEY